MENFEISLNEFIFRIQEMMNQEYKVRYPALIPPTIKVEPGSRYIRVVTYREHDGRVVEHAAYCFVEKATGDIFKAASYKAPAKHARGNITDPHGGMSWLTCYGVRSMR